MAEAKSRGNTRRPYHSPVRKQQAEQTRERILAAAREKFRSAGYAASTLAAIASGAQVSTKTVEAAYGSELLRGAVAVAPEIGAVARQIERRRRDNQSRLVAYLTERGALRAGLTPEEAIAVIWALSSYDMYRSLVGELGWPPERYQAWLAGILIAIVLADPSGDQATSRPLRGAAHYAVASALQARTLLIAERDRLALHGIPADRDNARLGGHITCWGEYRLAGDQARGADALGFDPHSHLPVLVADLGSQVDFQPYDDVNRIAAHDL